MGTSEGTPPPASAGEAPALGGSGVPRPAAPAVVLVPAWLADEAARWADAGLPDDPIEHDPAAVAVIDKLESARVNARVDRPWHLRQPDGSDATAIPEPCFRPFADALAAGFARRGRLDRVQPTAEVRRLCEVLTGTSLRADLATCATASRGSELAQPRYMSNTGYAHRRGCSAQHVRQQCKVGAIPGAVKQVGRWLIREDALTQEPRQ